MTIQILQNPTDHTKELNPSCLSTYLGLPVGDSRKEGRDVQKAWVVIGREQFRLSSTRIPVKTALDKHSQAIKQTLN